MTTVKQKFVIRDGVDFVCPFCGKPCTATLEHAAVLHTAPTCDTFNKLDPAEFLHAVNQRRLS